MGGGDRGLPERLGVPAELRPLVGALQRFRAVVAAQSMELWLRLDLTTAQLAALHAVWRLGPISGRQLAERLGVSAPAIVKLCDRLEARGYVERVRDKDDRRVQWFRLTPAGAAVFDEVVAINRARLRPALERLSPDDRAVLARALDELAAAVEAAR